MHLLLVNTVARREDDSLGLRLDALDARADRRLVAEVAALQGRNRILLGNGLLRVVELVDLRGASYSLETVRMASKIEKKPPTTFSPGGESRRWREGVSTQRDAEIARAASPSECSTP